VLNTVRITSIAAATLLASPAFAAWPFAETAQAEQIEDQRIINEVVVNGRVMEADSDETFANGLHPAPNWTGVSGPVDRRLRQSY